MNKQKLITALIIVAALVFLVATVAVAASSPGDIFDKANRAVGTVQALAGLLVATGLYLKIPKSAQSVVDAALKVPPDFADQLKAKLGTPAARAVTIEEFVVKEAQARGIPLAPDQIHALVTVLTPLAKKIRLRIP